MWHVETDYVALAIFLIMLVKEHSQPEKEQDMQAHAFYKVLIFSIVNVLIDIISSLSMNYATNWLLYQLTMTVYVASMPLLAAVWTVYAYILIHKNNPSVSIRKGIVTITIPFILYVLLALSNPFTELFFHLSKSMVYSRGILFMPVGVGMIMAYSAAGLLLVLAHKQQIQPQTNVFLLISFFLTTALFIWVQLAHPGWLIINASYAVIYVWCDITVEDQRRAELYMQIQNTNEAMKTALDQAQAATQAKSDFLSHMSHDIRTPLNAVMGFSTLLSEDPGNEKKVREYTGKINAAGSHLLSLINDILDISKIESGKIAMQQSVFSLSELIEATNTVIRPMAGAKKQTFHIEFGHMKHELFIGDKVRINQILLNLLSNAVKYTPECGHITLKIKDKENSSNMFEQVEIQVIDDGYGISEDFQKIIFDPFTRADNSNINREIGTGLGLAITKNIIDLMGGVIEVNSKLHEGSTFTVELPLRIPEEEQDNHFWENHHISQILLVDDEKSVCDMVRNNMKGTGVELDAVYSGEEAIALVEEKYKRNQKESSNESQPYNAIILDWQMPGMNGLDTAREIRKLVPTHTPVLFLTSYDWSEIEEEAIELDVDGFLAKPFDVLNLKEKILEIEHDKTDTSVPITEADLHGRHFLVAEDNPLNAEILTELLRVEGATCDVEGNGRSAVERFVSSPPATYDAVLMDIMMPVLDGYEATKMLRASDHPEADTIPVIAMTANAFVKDVHDALDAGMNAHIAKPVNMHILKQTLAGCMDN